LHNWSFSFFIIFKLLTYSALASSAATGNITGRSTCLMHLCCVITSACYWCKVIETPAVILKKCHHDTYSTATSFLYCLCKVCQGHFCSCQHFTLDAALETKTVMNIWETWLFSVIKSANQFSLYPQH
jgi:hypothetical protein